MSQFFDTVYSKGAQWFHADLFLVHIAVVAHKTKNIKLQALDEAAIVSDLSSASLKLWYKKY